MVAAMANSTLWALGCDGSRGREGEDKAGDRPEAGVWVGL